MSGKSLYLSLNFVVNLNVLFKNCLIKHPQEIFWLFIIARTWKQSKCPSMDENRACIHNEILSSLRKERNPFICYNMDESGGHYAKLNKSVTEGQILHDSTYKRHLK